MDAPWIEVIPPQGQSDLLGPGFMDYQWQGLFACEIKVPSHADWVGLRWGFNAAALLGEALERQKLFLESQHGINGDLRIEDPGRHTLALRFICHPDIHFVVSVIGKVYARSREHAEELALNYFCALKSSFPYDYILTPATSQPEFSQLSGWDILMESGSCINIAQIKRCEVPILLNRTSPFVQGLWHSGDHAHEQIWRSIAGWKYPILMNTILRPTVLYENDIKRLVNDADEISRFKPDLVPLEMLAVYKEWEEKYLSRRLAPWQKFFYLQVHLASPREIDNTIIRAVGTSLTLSAGEQTQPGYQVRFPELDEQQAWRQKIRDLDVIFSGSYLPNSRMSEIADLDEVFQAMRIPYSPPGDGLSVLVQANMGG